MNYKIPANRKALLEALELSEEIIGNIELGEIPLANIALKTARLARILNDFEMAKIMEYETSGYTANANDFVPHDEWKIAVKAGRLYVNDDNQERVYPESIEQLEEELKITEIALQVAKDPDLSISSSNPRQFLNVPMGNWKERKSIRDRNRIASLRISSRRSFIFRYALRKHYELKFSNISDDIFTRIREKVDSKISKILPDSVKRFSAVYENLQSDNPENWSNAVHSCRRILEDLADAVYPPTEVKKISKEGNEKIIKLGKENYINRILTFIEENSSSERFKDLVGSNLRFIEDRLKNVFRATQKGSHTTIVSKEEADRYVVYTYLIIGDIISLKE